MEKEIEIICKFTVKYTSEEELDKYEIEEFYTDLISDLDFEAQEIIENWRDQSTFGSQSENISIKGVDFEIVDNDVDDFLVKTIVI